MPAARQSGGFVDAQKLGILDRGENVAAHAEPIPYQELTPLNITPCSAIGAGFEIWGTTPFSATHDDNRY